MERKNGFTIAELLLGLLISMVVATAMVPIVGPKKITSPNQKISHGEFYCFYDQAGNLHQFMRNNSTLQNGNGNNGQGAILQGADRCEFSAPSASYFTITLIGAGGDGGGGFNSQEMALPANNIRYTAFADENSRYGSISTGDSFSNDYSSAPGEIKDLISSKLGNKLTAKYTISAAAGRRGSNQSRSGDIVGGMQRTANAASMQSGSQTVFEGTLGGSGAEVTLVRDLLSTSSVSITDGNNVGIDIDGKNVYISKAGDGAGAWCTGSSVTTCHNGSERGITPANSVVTTNISQTEKTQFNFSQTTLSPGQSSTGNMSVSSDPDSFYYAIQKVEFEFRYGERGNQGSVEAQLIPKMEANHIYAIPARFATEVNAAGQEVPTYTRLVADNGLGYTSDLVKPAVSGTRGNVKTSRKYESFDATKAFPSDLFSSVVSEQWNQYEKVRIGNNIFYPGAPGSGAYAMVYNLTVAPGASIASYNKNSKQAEEFYASEPTTYSGSKTCYNSATPADAIPDPGNSNLYRCAAQRGWGGAVIIKW